MLGAFCARIIWLMDGYLLMRVSTPELCAYGYIFMTVVYSLGTKAKILNFIVTNLNT